MPLYTYICSHCEHTEEHVLPVAERDVPEVGCTQCFKGIMKRGIGNNGGFRLGENGSVGWAKDGYGSTWGDIANARAGRKVY